MSRRYRYYIAYNYTSDQGGGDGYAIQDYTMKIKTTSDINYMHENIKNSIIKDVSHTNVKPIVSNFFIIDKYWTSEII